MGRLGWAVVVTVALCGLAYAQASKVEIFDRSGLPARAGTDRERELLRRAAQHRRGDIADAVAVQRMLGAYYREKGDTERARVADERAKSAELPGAGPVSVYQPDAPASQEPSVSMYQPESGSAAPPVGEPAPAIPLETTPLEAAAPTAGPQAPAGRFYFLQGRVMHSWEFRPDGTFEHGWADTRPGAAAYVEAGRFTVAGPYMTLFVLRDSAGASPRQPRRLRFQPRGTAIVLDGMTLAPKLP